MVHIHKLKERAAFSLEMGYTPLPGALESLEGLEIHRDDRYSFLLIETGKGLL